MQHRPISGIRLSPPTGTADADVSAAVEAEEVTRSVGRHFVERLFEGSMANAVSHLLQTRDVSRDELDQIEKFVRQAKRRAK